MDTILIAVNHREIHLKTLESLVTSGFDALGARDWSLMFSALQAERPAAVLIDPDLPGVTGIQLERFLRARSPTSSRFILFPTPERTDELATTALLGADGIVAQDACRATLVETLGAVLRAGEPLVPELRRVRSSLVGPATTKPPPRPAWIGAI